MISVETAARQAAERGHSLLDEIRILMVSLIDICIIISMFFTLLLESLALLFMWLIYFGKQSY